MNLKSLTVVAFALFLSACSTKALDDMNYGLSKAMGKHVRLVEQALGKPAESTPPYYHYLHLHCFSLPMCAFLLCIRLGVGYPHQ